MRLLGTCKSLGEALNLHHDNGHTHRGGSQQFCARANGDGVGHWETALSSFRKLEPAEIGAWDTDGTARADYEDACFPVLRHASVWVHQAQELGLKARIACVSPYLLIAGDPRGRGPARKDACRSTTPVQLTRPISFAFMTPSARPNCRPTSFVARGRQARPQQDRSPRRAWDRC